MTKEEFDALPAEQKIKELKAAAYDSLSVIEFHQRNIQTINQQIEELSKKEQE